MHQLILILLLVFLSLAGCSDRAAETMVYETKEPVPEETADYDKEYRRTEDQVGFVKVTSKYYFTTPLIQDIAEGFVPLRDHAVSFGGNRNSAVSRYIPGDRGDVYLHDLTAADEWYSAQNGLIHIAADGKKERICVLPDCTVEDTCPHMQFYNMRGVYAAGCLYFVCPDTAIDGSVGPVSVPGFILKYDIAEREMVKFMEIPAYEQVWCLTAADDVLYIAYQDFVSGDGFYAVDLADEGEIPAACRYRVGQTGTHIGGIMGDYIILASEKGRITAYDTASGMEYLIEEHERAEFHGIAVTPEKAWAVYTTETAELTLELRAYNIETHITRALQIMNPVFDISRTGGVYFIRQYPERVLCRYDPDTDRLETLADQVVAFNAQGDGAVYLRQTSAERVSIPYTARTRTYPGSFFWEYSTEYRYGSRDLTLGSEKTGQHVTLWQSNDRECTAGAGSLYLAGNTAYLSVYVPGDGEYKSIPMEVLRVPLHGGSKQTVSEYLDGGVVTGTEFAWEIG